ncbi:hypothetical protein [Shewanella waksmanii]|uniref:hypothetical protein n=1 Tax=Shewanella waksmanii TaxID=213783 RepID=UPI0037357D6F
MKKIVLASALVGLVAVSNGAAASEFTINPMLGVSHNKAFKPNVAAGVELGYKDVLFGYTYTGDKKDSTQSEVFDFDGSAAQVTAGSNEQFKAHSVYLGYQFAVGTGHLAVKVGVDYSKYRNSLGIHASTLPNSNEFHKAGVSLNGSSGYELSPMVGVGYYLDNGLNFNLHYTFQSGDRDMTVSGSGYIDDKKGSTAGKRVKSAFDNKDLGTVMFTVGYRF